MKKYLLFIIIEIVTYNVLAQKKNIEWVIKPILEYDDVFPFSDQYAKVLLNDKYGFINKAGNVVISLIYDDAKDFKNGVAFVKKNDRYGLIDKKGIEIYPCKCETKNEYLSLIDNSLILVCNGKPMNRDGDSYDYDSYYHIKDRVLRVKKGNKYGFIDDRGNEIVSPKYDYADHFSDGLAVVKKNGKYSFINKKGKEIIPFTYYDNFWSFSDGLALVSIKNQYQFINKTGKTIIDIGSKYQYVNSFSEGLAKVGKGGKYGFIDTKGKEKIPLSYKLNELTDFLKGVAVVRQGGKAGYINKNGEVVIPCKYDYASPFWGDYAKIFKEGLHGLIDSEGIEVIPLEYDYIYGYTFKGGLIKVKKGNKEYLLSKKNNLYDVMTTFNKEGLTKVTKNDKYGFINESGEVIVPLEYDYAGDFSDGMAEVCRKGKYGDCHSGYIDKTGKVIVPLIYRGNMPFSNGLGSVSKVGESFYVSKKGTLYTIYEVPTRPFATEGLVGAMKWTWKRYGFKDEKGKVIIPFIFKEIRPFSEGVAFVKKGKKWGIIRNPLFKNLPTHNLVWLNPNLDEYNHKNHPSQQLLIKLKAFSNTGDARLHPQDFQIFRNNQRQTTKSGEISLRGTTFNAIITLQEGKNNIKVCIEDNCSKTLTAYYTAAKPNLHLLAIGTNPPDLQYTEKDARDFANTFQDQHQLFGNIFIERLLGDNATRTAISEQLQMLNNQYKEGHIRPNDVLMLFISSHGYIESQDNNRFRIQASNFNPAFYKTRSIAYEEITQTLSTINCKKIIWIDACHSGGAKANPALINRYIQQLNDTYAGITTITSSTRNQKSYEHAKWQNGAFTEALLKGLSGKADGKGTGGRRDGVMTLNEIYAYIREQVPQLVKGIQKPTQEPQMTRDELGDLPIFVW